MEISINKIYKIKFNSDIFGDNETYIENIKVLDITDDSLLYIEIPNIKYLDITLPEIVTFDTYDTLYAPTDDSDFFIELTKKDNIYYTCINLPVEFIELIN